MNLPIENSNFEDYPIEFKEINPEDFKYTFQSDGTRVERNDFNIENNGEKVIIEPNDEGYINEVLQEALQLEHKNTVVINAAVGQGKSYAIIQTIKMYYDKIQNEDQKYLIFVASPFVSLVKQYCEDIEKAGIPANQIYNYNKIGRDETSYLDKPIHVITANTLLGNPGEDGFKNSDEKRDYLNSLVSYCRTFNIQAVFIYDELHDSYQNFKQEYIFNLWKWKSVIHKNFVLSATFNEASKIVLEYLAELTDFNIKIIESKRVIQPDEQSALYLHFSSDYNFTTNTTEIKNIITDLVDRDKNIDVLCYSKKLAQNIINPKDELGNLLTNKFGELKDCTSELVTNQRPENEEPKNQYDNTKCNIGTNFKTGVSIRKENHAFVIIMPPRATRLWFRNKYGIFSGGINSVIQALARQRTKGEIHVVLPNPDEFDYSSLEHSSMSNSQKEEFMNYYDLLKYYKAPEKKVKYIKLNRQDYFMRNFYEQKLKGNVVGEIEQLDSSSRSYNMPKLAFPTYEEFKLEKGEDYLANDIPFFGGDISAYMTYSAITNQFVNCTLKGLKFRPIILFKENEIQDMLRSVYSMFFGEDHLDSLGEFSNFPMFYSEIKEGLFKGYHLKLKRIGNDDYENIKPNTIESKKFEIQLMNFVFNLWKYKVYPSTDTDYSRADYFLDSIANSIDVNLESLEEGEFKNRVIFYQALNKLREKLIASLHEHQWGNEHFYCVPTTLWDGFFSQTELIPARQILSLWESDRLLRDNVFEFKRRFEKCRTINSKLKKLYSLLIEDFLVTENRENDPKINIHQRRRNVKPIISVKIVPNTNFTINLVSSQDYNFEIFDTIIDAHISRVEQSD